MSRSIKRRISSLAYFMQKAYWKMVTAKPSVLVIATITIAVFIFLLGGGVYDLLEKPLVAIVESGGRILVYYPRSLNEQFLLESFIVMTIYAIGVAGFLLMYQSTKYAYKPRQAFMLLLVGCIFIIVAYICIEIAFLARWRV